MTNLNHFFVNLFAKTTANKKQIRCIVDRFIGLEVNMNPSLVSIVAAHFNCKPIVKMWDLLIVVKRITSISE
jgi:menaquinone-dependent protoporphyrinogen IX oxidase